MSAARSTVVVSADLGSELGRRIVYAIAAGRTKFLSNGDGSTDVRVSKPPNVLRLRI